MFTGKLGSLARLAQRSLATGADIQANTNAVDNDALLVHVRAEIPIGAALGETHIISKSLGLATDITLPGHGQLPSNHLSYRNDSGIQLQARPEARGNHNIMCARGHQDIAEQAAIQR